MLKNLKQAMVDGIRAAALRRRYHLVPDWEIDGYPLAAHLRRLFGLYRIDCALDVGGNLGQYRDLLRRKIGFEGWVISFEPVRKYAQHLRRRAEADARWRIVDCALGAAAGSAEIHVTQSPGLNSFLRPSSAALPDFWAKEQSRAETVRIERLDDLLPELQRETGFASPYLKLDTQGFDLEVIKGAGQSLAQIRALQTEASVQAIYAGMPNWKDSVRTLEELGFEVSGMFPVSHDKTLRLIEFDCVMLNKAYL